MKITPFSGAASLGGLHVARQCGAAGEPRARGGVSPDICKFSTQGTVQLYATASHRLDAVANIESIYRFFKKFRTFLLPPKNEQSSHKKHRSYHVGR